MDWVVQSNNVKTYQTNQQFKSTKGVTLLILLSEVEGAYIYSISIMLSLYSRVYVHLLEIVWSLIKLR